jgi:hypothetical protein
MSDGKDSWLCRMMPLDEKLVHDTRDFMTVGQVCLSQGVEWERRSGSKRDRRVRSSCAVHLESINLYTWIVLAICSKPKVLK